MKPSLTLLPTFDYELFLGRDSGTVDACLIRPTELLLQSLERLNLRAVFFVDTIYLLRLKEMTSVSGAASCEYERVCQQIIRIGAGGHDVFPHLHPHWLDAVFDPQSNRWSLEEYRYYMMSSCPDGLRAELMGASVEWLRDLLGSKLREPLGYRAGGWCIQPFSVFRPLFEQWGITADFSVVPGRESAVGAATYDFSEVSTMTPYRFSGDVCKADLQGSFMEFPISVIPTTGIDRKLDRFASKLFWRLGSGRMMGDGKGALPAQAKSGVVRAAPIVNEMASLDHFGVGKIPSYVRTARRDGVLHLCSHPKLLSRHGLWAFSQLVHVLRRQFSINTDWRSLFT